VRTGPERVTSDGTLASEAHEPKPDASDGPEETVYESTSPSAVAPPPQPRSWRRGVVLTLALLAVVLLGRALGGYVPAFADWVEGLGAVGPLVFVVGYALAVVAVVPAALLTLVAGAIFGLWRGVILTFVAAVLGSCLAFGLARHGARRVVERRVARNPRFAAVDRAVGREGFRIVFLLRLSPVFPFTLLNYALGVTRVGFMDYLLASIGMLPGTVLYVYTGKVLGTVAAVAGGARPQQGAADWVLLGVGLVATLAVTVEVTRLARRALAEASLA
jgi:uncharacterized membrane protein YdjX (TVP38/TMEM64 family)